MSTYGDLFRRATRELRRRSSGEIYLGTKEDGGEFHIPSAWLHDTHAHFVGPSQSGKTRALELVVQQLMDAGVGSILVVDPHDGAPPHGGLFSYLKSYCYTHGHEDRLILIDPHDGDRHGISPGLDPFRHGAKPTIQAAIGVEHIRAVCGDAVAWAASPMLARWGFNLNLGLIEGQLAIADGRHVVNAADPEYRRIFGELLHKRFPDVAGDWQWLAEHEHIRQLLDDKLNSVTNRWRNYAGLENVRWMLNTRRYAIDFPEALRERKIILANLSTGGLGGQVLIEEAQRMLGIHLIESAIRAALNRQNPEREPLYLVIDEFQLFLTPLVLKILNETAKYGLHLILAHQFLSQLQDVAAQDYRYFHAVMTNARFKVVFGGAPPEDSEILVKHLYGAYLDPDRVKQEIYHKAQLSYQLYERIVTTTTGLALHSTEMHGSGRAHLESDTQSRGAGSSAGHGHVTSSGFADSTGGSETLFAGLSPSAPTFSTNYSHVFSGSVSDSDMAGRSEMAGDAHTSADTASEFDAVAKGETLQFSRSEAIVPVTKPGEVFDELTSREFMQLQEQLYRYEADLRRRPKQHAVAAYRGEYPIPFRIGNVPEPELMQEEVFPIDGELLHQVPWAARVEVIEDEARERDADFRNRLPKPKAPTRTPPHLLPAPTQQIVVELDVIKLGDASVRVQRKRTKPQKPRGR